MTNEVRWRRKITLNPCCCHCLTEVETIIYVLRDCPRAPWVWDRIVEVGEREAFYSDIWYTWLVNNLSNHLKSRKMIGGLNSGLFCGRFGRRETNEFLVHVIRRLVGDINQTILG